MSDSLEQLEQRVLAGYRRQASHYERALRLLEQRDAVTNWAQDLHAILEEVAGLEPEYADAKAAWQQSGKTPGVELRAVLDRLAEQIRVLRAMIDSQVAELLARKQRLVPEIDDFIRRRWMLNAYGQSKA
jgi:hypothetical protein